MGFPLSRFEQLSELSNGYMKQSFEQFKLTAVVLHEHNDHIFKDKMQQLFKRLDKLTGENFLFITFITPPQSWSRYKGDFNRLSKLNLNAESGMDDIVVLSKLKRAFGLEYANLPVILLTDNISGRDFIWFQTSAEQIDDHLLEIAQFCDQQDQRPNLTDDSVKDLTKNLGGGHLVHISTSISNIICEIDAEQGIGNLNNRPDLVSKIKLNLLQTKLNLALSILNNCTELISKYNNEIDEDIWIKYDEALQKMADCIPALSGIESIDLSNPPSNYKRRRFHLGDKKWGIHTYRNTWGQQNTQLFPIIEMDKYPGCEDNTKSLYYQYEITAVCNKFLPEVQDLRQNLPYDNVKYTTMAFLLGKIFETEVSSSIVQMMRYSLGIEMPQYFCSYQEGNECIIPGLDNYQNVNLNKGFNNQWEAPALGQSLYAYRYLQQNPRNHFVDWGKEFVGLWKSMKVWRNKADHTGFLNIDGFSKAHGTFVNLQENYFARMMEMKMNLKNQSNIILCNNQGHGNY